MPRDATLEEIPFPPFLRYAPSVRLLLLISRKKGFMVSGPEAYETVRVRTGRPASSAITWIVSSRNLSANLIGSTVPYVTGYDGRRLPWTFGKRDDDMLFFGMRPRGKYVRQTEKRRNLSLLSTSGEMREFRASCLLCSIPAGSPLRGNLWGQKTALKFWNDNCLRL